MLHIFKSAAYSVNVWYCCRSSSAAPSLHHKHGLCPGTALVGGYTISKRVVMRRKAHLFTQIAFWYQSYDVDPFWDRWVVRKFCRHEVKGLQLHCCAGCVQSLYAQPIHSDEGLHLGPCKRSATSTAEYVYAPADLAQTPNHNFPFSIRLPGLAILVPLRLRQVCRRRGSRFVRLHCS